MAESLENVKVGDILVVRAEYGDRIATVERLTQTQVITDIGKFYKNTGRPLNCSSFDFRCAYIATPEDIAQVKRQQIRRKLVSKVRNTRFNDLSDSQLKAILEIVNRQTKER